MQADPIDWWCPVLKKALSDAMSSILSVILWICIACVSAAMLLACFGLVGRAMAWCLGA